MAKKRVVITGMGLISPVGNSVATAWDNILAGRSGIGPITLFDTEGFSTKIAGEINDFNVSDYLSPKEARKVDTFVHYTIAAAQEAQRDAGLEITDANAHRVGVAVGSGIGGIGTIEKGVKTLNTAGPRRVSPFFIPSSIVNMAAGYLSSVNGAKGPNFCMVTACTTSTHNIGLAARTIAYGDADVMFAGGAEQGCAPTSMAGFCSARAMSTRNDDPTAASRPFDQERDGFVLSDGAAILVLEDMEHAKKRGATLYAEVVGFGNSGDAYHMTAPPEDGDGARRCMENALVDAGVNPEQVDYINAHGTSTSVGDIAETIAIKSVLGDHAYKTAVSSTKSMTGHLLGAAGGIEAIISTLAIRDQVVPPTINLDNPDPACDLDYVPHTARDTKLDIVISNSFGFGGTNGSIVLSRL